MDKDQKSAVVERVVIHYPNMGYPTLDGQRVPYLEVVEVPSTYDDLQRSPKSWNLILDKRFCWNCKSLVELSLMIEITAQVMAIAKGYKNFKEMADATEPVADI